MLCQISYHEKWNILAGNTAPFLAKTALIFRSSYSLWISSFYLIFKQDEIFQTRNETNNAAFRKSFGSRKSSIFRRISGTHIISSNSWWYSSLVLHFVSFYNVQGTFQRSLQFLQYGCCYLNSPN